MKTIITATVILAALIAFSLAPKADAQAGRVAAAAGSPPIGCVCEVRVLSSILAARTEVETVRGTLLSMTSEWVVLKDGSFENWVPREKIITLRASR